MQSQKHAPPGIVCMLCEGRLQSNLGRYKEDDGVAVYMPVIQTFSSPTRANYLKGYLWETRANIDLPLGSIMSDLAYL